MKQISYTIATEYIELNHLLKLTGFADSGGAGGALVSSGVVKVDGQVELRKRNKVRPGQVVEIGDTAIRVLPDPSGLVPTGAVKAKPTLKPRTPDAAQRRRSRGGVKPKAIAK